MIQSISGTASQGHKYFQVKDRVIVEPLEGATKLRAGYMGDSHWKTRNGKTVNGVRVKAPGNIFNGQVKAFSSSKLDSIQHILNLNGDTFGCLESGYRKIPPFDRKGKLIDPDFELEIFKEIIEDNPLPFRRMRKFLQASPLNQIILAKGNHDRPVFHSDGYLMREFLAEALLPDASVDERNKRILFSGSTYIPSLGIFSKHCDDLDPFNHSVNGESTTGDWVIVESSGIVNKIVTELRSDGIVPEVLDEAITKTEKTLRVRPPLAFPLYLRYRAEKLLEKFKTKEPDSAVKAAEIMMSYSDKQRESIMEKAFFKQFQEAGLLPEWLVKIILCERVQRIGTKLVSAFESWVSDNNGKQKKESERLFLEEGIRMSHFVGAHTHIGETDQYAIEDQVINYVNPGPEEIAQIAVAGRPLGSVWHSGMFIGEVDLTVPERRRKGRYEVAFKKTWEQKI